MDKWRVHRVIYPAFVPHNAYTGSPPYCTCKEINARWIHTLLEAANFTSVPCPAIYPEYDELELDCNDYLVTRMEPMGNLNIELEEWDHAVRWSSLNNHKPMMLLIINWNNSEELPKCPNATSAKISTKKRMTLNSLSSTMVGPTATTATTT